MCSSQTLHFKVASPRLSSLDSPKALTSRPIRTVHKLWKDVGLYATKHVSKSIPHCCDRLEHFVSGANILLVIHVLYNKYR